MNLNEVLEKIDILKKYNSETNRIEAKSALNGFPKKCYDTFSSFANKYGGIIIFGINEDDNFNIEGVYDVNDLQKQITSLCNDAMEPALRVDILPFEIDGKKLLAVKVDEIHQSLKPCYYKPKGLKAGSYTREGDRDSLMSDYEIYALQSYNDHIFEDKKTIKSATLDDLNIHDIKLYIDQLKNNKHSLKNNSFEKNLKLCNIVGEDLVPTLAGLLVFGESPQSFFPQLFVACTVIPGTEMGTKGEFGERFIDNRRVEGTIEEMLNESVNFVRRNMKTKVIIDSSGVRSNISEYPVDALREAIANALIHRDYSRFTNTMYVSVYMYSDRIEITSPGGLYGCNKLDDLDSETLLESRNPNLIKLLEEKEHVIENRHSGITIMKEEMEKYGLPAPEFYDKNGRFKVILRNSIDGQQINNDTQGDTQGDTQIINLNVKLINEILIFCKEPKSAKEIREHINISSKRYVAYKILLPLVNSGLLKHTNPNKNAKNQKYVSNK